MRLVAVVITLLGLAVTIGCGQPASDSSEGAAPAADSDGTDGRVVRDIGSAELQVARLVLDLDIVVARFVEPAHLLPLDRVQIVGLGHEPEDLDDALARCREITDYEITGGAEFIVGQGEGVVDASGSADCVVCGWAVICPGRCEPLGPGEVPRGDPSTYDTDPPDDDGTGGSGGDNGDSGGSGDGESGGTSGGSNSGAASGGTGGSHGGVGNPGDRD